jgi:hypothetical protein
VINSRVGVITQSPFFFINSQGSSILFLKFLLSGAVSLTGVNRVGNTETGG